MHQLSVRVLACLQESLEEGCSNVDGVVESFADVGIKVRSMVWNTDLIEVSHIFCSTSSCGE